MPSAVVFSVACFNPCFNGSDSKSETVAQERRPDESFNPCFNGSDSKRVCTGKVSARVRCFNPCFNGSDSKRREPDAGSRKPETVSILVLMEVTLKATTQSARKRISSFQSLF